MNNWLGPFKAADDAIDALRRSVAEIIGADPDTWPYHKNAPLAISAAVGLREGAIKQLTKERDALRAELDALKRQKPFHRDDRFQEAFEKTLRERGWNAERDGSGYRSGMAQHAWFIALGTASKLKLYADPVPASVPDVLKITRDFMWVSEKQHHIPTLILEFTPVPANSPNDAKGWKDRDNLAAMLAAAPKPEMK